MYIQNKLVAAFYKLSLGLISVYGFWMTLAAFGATAWRLFSTWALMIGAVYFCISALILALSSKRESGDTPCPMLEGALIVAFLLQAITAIACAINDDYLPGLSGFAAVLTYYILPVLTLLDWCLFNKKGLWRAIDPFHWLALPLAYSAMIILTANMLPSSTNLLYPVAFLDYNKYGLWETLGWLALGGLLILIFGYILILLDAFMGGIIAKHIVLPHIRTVTIEDEEAETEDSADALETEASEELDVFEPDEIITAKPKTPRQKTQPADKSKSRPAHAQTASKTTNNKSANKTSKTQNTQKSTKSSSPKPAGKRKINDITKPKNPQSK